MYVLPQNNDSIGCIIVATKIETGTKMKTENLWIPSETLKNLQGPLKIEVSKESKKNVKVNAQS